MSTNNDPALSTVVGLIHPGAMGAVIGSVLGSVLSHPVLWAGSGRSAETHERARRAGLDDVDTLDNLVAHADVILSVCPPEAAVSVAADVVATGYDGVYVDANAVSPATARSIGVRFERFVDGGIIGPPPGRPNLTRLYLAGSEPAGSDSAGLPTDAERVAGLFSSTAVECRLVDGGAGAASAVKMAFASWTKGTSALLLAIRALAEAEGVTDALVGEWATSMPDLLRRSEQVAGAVGPKAWRFEGEMREIADSFEAQGLPGDFHRGAAEVYRRLAPLQRASDPDLAEALELLTATEGLRS